MTVKRIKQTLRSWLGQKSNAEPSSKSTYAKFFLEYRNNLIGVLEYQDGEWVFTYSEEFKLQDDLRPIVEFPEVDKKYQSRDLWLFFASRIPSLKQETVQEIAEHESIDLSDETQLLRRFGKRTVANPYKLKSA